MAGIVIVTSKLEKAKVDYNKGRLLLCNSNSCAPKGDGIKSRVTQEGKMKRGYVTNSKIAVLYDLLSYEISSEIITFEVFPLYTSNFITARNVVQGTRTENK